MSPQERRIKKLIEPRIQLRFALIFLTIAALSALVQALVQNYLMMRVADLLPHDGVALKSHMFDILGRGLVLTLLVLVPVTMSVGIASMHKIVGPLYRFRVYLTELVAGATPEPCKVRDTDELQDICELLNLATESLRKAPAHQSDHAQRQAS